MRRMAIFGYEWDEAKRALSIAKHGFDFGEVNAFGWTDSIVVPDERTEYGEPRFRAYGYLRGTACVVVFTRRGQLNRIISLRRANARERERHGL